MPRPKARSHRDLLVWQKARQLVRCAYVLTRSLPRHERFGLASQIQRAALSVASNIAEGWGRGTRRELHHFATIARGSTYELDTQFDAVEDLEYLPTESVS